jgi:hypothetical protein
MKYRLAGIISKTGGSDQMIIVVMVIIFCCIVSLMGGYGRYILMLPVEGDKCEMKDDENAEGIVDEESKCKFVRCKDTYATDTTGICVLDQSGEDCQGSITNAIYETNVSNVCEFNRCIIGYELGENDICVEGTGGGGGGAGAGGGGAGASSVPIACVGSWEDTTPGGECRYGCGPETRNESYSITTASAYGGTSCPHTAGESRTRDCGNPACPTVDTTETIDGIQFQVKYYDDRDGHSNYSYYNTELGFFWEGNKKEMTGIVSGEKRGGTDGYYYIIGTTQNNELKWRQTTEEYITKSIIKRSVNAVAPVEDTNGTCILNATHHASRIAKEQADYDCNGICTSKTSRGTCLNINTYCDYRWADDPGGYYGRMNARLDSACEWVPN